MLEQLERKTLVPEGQHFCSLGQYSKDFIEETVTGDGTICNTNFLQCQISATWQYGVHPSPSGTVKEVAMEYKRRKKHVIDTPNIIKVGWGKSFELCLLF